MSITENFLVNTKNFDAIIDELRSASDLPEKITNKFLEQQGYSNPSDLLVLHLFKDLSMLNDDGTPTELFKKFRNDDTEISKQAMAQGIVEAYVDLFKNNSLVYRSGMAELKEEFKKFFGSSKSDLILKYMANTFLTLVEYAGSKNVEAMSEKYLENVSGIEEVIREVAEKQKNGSDTSSAGSATEEEIAVAETDDEPVKSINKEEKGDIDIDQIINFTDSGPAFNKVEKETSGPEPPDVVEHVEAPKNVKSTEEENEQPSPEATDEPRNNSAADRLSEESGQIPENQDIEEENASFTESVSERSDSENDMTGDPDKNDTDEETGSAYEEQENEAEENEPSSNETIFGLPVKKVEKEKISDSPEKKMDTTELENKDRESPMSQKSKEQAGHSTEEQKDEENDPFGFKAVMDFDKKEEEIKNMNSVQSAEPEEDTGSAEPAEAVRSEKPEVQKESKKPVKSEEPEEAGDEEKKKVEKTEEITAKPEPVKAPLPSTSSKTTYENKAFLKKAELLYKLGKYEEALPALKAVIEKYDDSRESEYSDHVARSVVHYAFVLEKLDRTREALAAYEEVYRRFENSEKIEYYNQASNALIKRVELMEKLDLDDKITPLYSKVIDRLSESDNPRYMKYVDKAYFAQFEKLTESDDPNKVLRELTGFIDRFSNSEQKNKYLKKAMYMKAELLEQLGKEEEALEAYDSILQTFGNES